MNNEDIKKIAEEVKKTFAKKNHFDEYLPPEDRWIVDKERMNERRNVLLPYVKEWMKEIQENAEDGYARFSYKYKDDKDIIDAFGGICEQYLYWIMKELFEDTGIRFRYEFDGHDYVCFYFYW